MDNTNIAGIEMAASDIGDIDPAWAAADRGPTARGILWSATAVSLVFVMLRCYVRLWARRIFGADDALVLASMALLIAYTAVIDVGTRRGLGHHLDVVIATQSPQRVQDVSLIDLVAQPLVLTACSLGKSAFAVTLLRLGVRTWIRVVLWVIIVSINLLHGLVSIFMFTRCEDPRTQWVPGVESKCWDAQTFVNLTLTIAAYSTAVDFVLALIPWFIIWNLHGLKKAQKLGIAVAMSLGIFAGVTAIIKTTYLVPYGGPEDFTYKHMELIWWAGAECALILVGATIPTLKPLLSTLRRIVGGTTHSSGDNKSYELSSPRGRTTIGRMATTAVKKKHSQWSVIGDTVLGEATQADQGSDDYHSDRGILDTRISGGPARWPESSSEGRHPNDQIRVDTDLKVTVS